MIRKPLQELRDAATLPPEELKRRDELRAQRKAEEAVREEEQRRKREAEEAERKVRESRLATEAAAQPVGTGQAGASADHGTGRAGASTAHLAGAARETAAATTPLVMPAEVISPNGTMIAASPPPAEDLRTLTPLPDLSPPPVVGQPGMSLPPPLPRPPRPGAIEAEATVVDLHAQLKAVTDAQRPTAGRPGPLSTRAARAKPAAGKDEGKKG